jgi:hypothetical protein
VTQTRLGLLAFAFAAAAATGGCSRAHLSSNYGQSYAAWFSAQHVNAKPANAEAGRRIVESVDAQEASMVSKSYRRGVGRGTEDATGGRMLMIGPQRGGSDVYVPPPSVPGQ